MKDILKYDISEELKKHTASVRSHNIDIDEIMGMFYAALCFLSSKMRVQKNKVVDYLDSFDYEKKKKM